MPDELFDICFNFTHSAFRKDEQQVLDRAVSAGVTTMMVTGSSVEESERCVALAQRYPEYLYATVGVHPHLSSEWGEASADTLRSLATHPEVRAIGETGLDFNRDYSPREAQRLAFEAQVTLAETLQMPLFLHQRDAHGDFMEILAPRRAALGNVVVHCFTGTQDELADYLDLDLHIGITGWICDERRGRHLLDLLPRIPLQRLMIETDSPYLLPRDLQPRPRGRRNEPAYLPHVLRTLARRLRLPEGELARVTTRNARSFFGIARH